MAGEHKKNEKVGEVVSTKMHKTIVVQVSRRVPHPLYHRIVMKHKKFYAHDEDNQARVGDVVRIIECRLYETDSEWRAEAICDATGMVDLHPISDAAAGGRGR